MKPILSDPLPACIYAPPVFSFLLVETFIYYSDRYYIAQGAQETNIMNNINTIDTMAFYVIGLLITGGALIALYGWG